MRTYMKFILWFIWIGSISLLAQSPIQNQWNYGLYNYVLTKDTISLKLLKENNKSILKSASDQQRLVGDKKMDFDEVLMQWNQGDSSVYTYDANNGNLVNNFKKTLDVLTSNWVNQYYFTYIYNDLGLVVEEKRQTWNSLNGWENFSKELYTYNTENLLVEEINQTFSGGSWNNYTRTVYAYDANHFYDTITFFIWNSGLNSWNRANRTILDFNSNGYNTYILFQQWNGSDWENVFEESLSLNNNNLLQYRLKRYWSSVSNSWINDVKDTVIFITETSCIKTTFLWDDLNQLWNKSLRRSYEYSSSFKKTYELLEYWDNSQIMWAYSTREFITYDFNDNLWHVERESWDDFSSTWMHHRAENYTYNTYNNLVYFVENAWHQPSMSWIEVHKEYYWYELNPFAGMESIHNYTGFLVYPNPANERINIRFNYHSSECIQIIVMNNLSQILDVLQFHVIEGENNLELDIRSFKPGYYWLVGVKGNNRLFVKPLVVD